VGVLFIEPFGGLAGDMLLAALCDLGDERFGLADLRGLAEALVPGEADLAAQRVWRGGLSGNHLSVQTPESQTPPHRYYRDLEQLLERADVSERVRDVTLRSLWTLAQAEARVHGTTPEEIHFHEVGAVDTLIDIAGAALALERLGVERVYCSPPLVGSGTVTCAHGVMPVPAPAVAELVRDLEIRTGGGCERLTPTAAALLRTIVDDFAPPARFASSAIGYGAGTSDPREQPPNLCRVQLGVEQLAAQDASVLQLEVNLDDMTAQDVGHVIQKLREHGALEAWSQAVQMKKDRPGTIVTALIRAEQRADFEEVLFEWTTTLGVRWSRVERTECARRMLEVADDGLVVRVKLRERPGAERAARRDLAPEHDDLVVYAERRELSLREARERVVDLALRSLSGDPS